MPEPAAPQPPQYAPAPRELDDLDLLCIGALSAETGFGDPSLGVTLRLPAPIAAGALAAGAVELTDLEGAPLARIAVERVYDEGAEAVGVVGRVDRMHARADRVFGRLHLGPAELPRVATDPLVLACDRPPSTADLAAVRARATGRTVVLLALTGHGTPRRTSAEGLVRTCLVAARHLDRADVVAVALARRPGASADRAVRDRVLAAYAGEGEVVIAAGAGPLPDDVADAVARDRPTGTAQGLVLFFTGLSGSGKSTIARGVRNALLEQGERTVTLLDGDVVRRHLSAGLGFSPSDRDVNIRRIGWVAAEIARHGGTSVCSPIAPFDRTRRDVRAMVTGAGGAFVLVHVATPLAECERRDRKGLYARARRGEIPDFTGISSPYEPPQDADLRLDTTGRPVAEMVGAVLDLLHGRGLLGGPGHDTGAAGGAAAVSHGSSRGEDRR